MNFSWNKDTIGWYQEADEYTGFFRNLGNLIAPKLEEYSTLCDIGCGLGLIDLELSNRISEITCIDINPVVIEALQQRIKERGITNISPLIMDCTDLTGSWDVIYMSFFGSRDLEKLLPHCKKLIAVVGRQNQEGFYPEKYRKFKKSTAEEVEERLIQQEIKYNLTVADFEFGQPLNSLAEARNFVTTQSGNINFEDLTSLLEERLVETGKEEFPYYLPHKKSLGIFEIEGKL